MKNKIIIVLSILLFLAAAFYGFKSFKKTDGKNSPKPSDNTSAPATETPQIVSTKPDPLEDNIVAADGVVEITFNKPLQNSGEFKLKIEPTVEFKVDLSSDRKTARISFIKPLELGSTYTLFIGPETKFDGTGNWGQEKIFHVRTIVYKGV